MLQDDVISIKLRHSVNHYNHRFVDYVLELEKGEKKVRKAFAMKWVNWWDSTFPFAFIHCLSFSLSPLIIRIKSPSHGQADGLPRHPRSDCTYRDSKRTELINWPFEGRDFFDALSSSINKLRFKNVVKSPNLLECQLSPWIRLWWSKKSKYFFRSFPTCDWLWTGVEVLTRCGENVVLIRECVTCFHLLSGCPIQRQHMKRTFELFGSAFACVCQKDVPKIQRFS